MNNVVRFSLKPLLVAAYAVVAMLAAGMFLGSAQSAYAEEIDTSASYQNYLIQSGTENAIGGGITLGIYKDGAFFVHGACIETYVNFPSANGEASTYADKSTVDRNINGSQLRTLGDTKLEQVRKIVYVYSQTDKLAAYDDRTKYEATWAAIAKITCNQLPGFAAASQDDLENPKTGWQGLDAYNLLLAAADDSSVKPPAGQELAFFENKNEFGHKTQTLVALKLYGSSTPDPEIVNTTVTANGTAASEASEAKVTIKDGESVTLEDKVELKNLESGKTYKLEWTVVNVDTEAEVSSGDVTVAGGKTEVTIKPDKLSAEGTYTLKTRLTLDGTEVASHNADLDMKSETVVVTKEDTPSENPTVTISKTDATTGKELPGAKLTIKDKDGKVVEEWTSTETPHKVTLAPGTYTLTETTAPKGYETAESIEFTVDENGLVGSDKVQMKDKPTEESGGGGDDGDNNNSGTEEDDNNNSGTDDNSSNSGNKSKNKTSNKTVPVKGNAVATAGKGTPRTGDTSGVGILALAGVALVSMALAARIRRNQD